MEEQRGLAKFNGSMAVKPAVDLVLIIDRSGSMMGNEDAINKYYVEMLKNALASGRQVTLTTVLFDDNDSIELACDGKKIQNVGPLEYAPGGATALYDAYGAAIMHENQRKEDLANPYPHADVLYLAMTDGQENDSVKFNLEKLRNLIITERKRSDLGMGRREFAQITEFGVDKQKMGQELMLEDKAMQTFFRGDKGLRALFQTVILALKNMIEDKGITEKWKQLSDRLPVGKLSLGQLKAVAENSEKLMAGNDTAVAQLEQLAADGLTLEFQRLYAEVYARTKDVNAALAELQRDPELAELMGMYAGKNLTAVDSSYEKAVSKEFATVSQDLQSDLMALRAAAPADLPAILQKYDRDMKRLQSIPAICTDMRNDPHDDERLAARVRVITGVQEREFYDVISGIFKVETAILKTHPNLQIMEELSSDTIAAILSGNPFYDKYLELCKFMRARMPQDKLKRSVEMQGQQRGTAGSGQNPHEDEKAFPK